MEIIQILPRKEAFIAFLLLFKVEKERTSVQNVKVKKNGKGKTAEEPSHSNESSRLSKWSTRL